MKAMRVVLALGRLAGAGGGGACGADETETVTVLSSWTGEEKGRFQAVLDRFEAKTGVHVDPQGTRGLDQVLSAEVKRGTPPDIAVLPSLSAIADYARSGAAKPLDDIVKGGSSGSWEGLEKVGGKRYAVVVKPALKSMIWYDSKRLTTLQSGPPSTWDDLTALGRQLAGRGQVPWCVGMGSTPDSGWPGTDCIEDIVRL